MPQFLHFCLPPTTETNWVADDVEKAGFRSVGILSTEPGVSPHLLQFPLHFTCGSQWSYLITNRGVLLPVNGACFRRDMATNTPQGHGAE